MRSKGCNAGKKNAQDGSSWQIKKKKNYLVLVVPTTEMESDINENLFG